MNFNKGILTIGIYCIVLFFLSCQKDQDQELVPEPTTADRLQLLIDEKIGGDDKLIGVAVSIRVDGEERWNLVGGESAAGQPISSDMKFGVGSVTKTAVAATILKLEEEGLLSLDDSVGLWLPLNSPNIDRSITLFQLLTHFTGIKDYLQHPDIWATVEADLDHRLSAEQLVNFIGEPINTPGVTHEYSNSNYLLLALVVEEVTQQALGDVMRSKFWEPLQLHNIYFEGSENVQAPIAAAWRDSDGDGVLEDISGEYRDAYHSVFYGPAGIFATASDLSMWAYHLYQGDALSDSSQRKMQTSYFEYGHPIFLGYGLGTRKNQYGGKTTWGHTGGVRGYGAHMFYEPSHKVSIAILNNQSRSKNGPALRHELSEEIWKEVLSSL